MAGLRGYSNLNVKVHSTTLHISNKSNPAKRVISIKSVGLDPPARVVSLLIDPLIMSDVLL